MKRIIGLLLVAFVGLALLPASSAGAGGWALTTLDPLAPVRAGETVAVGFVIRQHGKTPVSLDDVRIEVRSATGDITAFDAVPDGAVGHYVAQVTFPTAGDVTWSVVQGWFGPQDLGALTVGAVAGPPSGTEPAWPAAVRVALPVLAAAAAAIAVVDAIRSRRRRILA